MKKFLFYVISVLMLAACSDDTPGLTPAEKNERTILAYLAANNNLDGYIQQNVIWMYQGLARQKKQSTLVIYYKPSSSNPSIRQAEILVYKTDGYGNINNQPALADSLQNFRNIVAQADVHTAIAGVSTDAAVMEANLKEMQTIAPALSYGLLFGSHATGWLEGEPVHNSGISTFSIGVDGVYVINLPEFAQTMERSFSNSTLDYIAFDACMMGTTEVCYELRNATHYCLVSAMETPADGIPYHRLMDDLFSANVNWTSVCSNIISYNRSEGLWGTFAAVDCTKMEELAEAVKNQLTTHIEELNALDYTTIQQFGVTSSYASDFKYFSFDVAEVIKALNGGSLPQDFKQILDETVVAQDCIDTFNQWPYDIITDKDKFCGIGMYLPTLVNRSWNNYYRSSIAWYKAAGWDSVAASAGN